MAESAPAQMRVSSERYLRLVDEGVLQVTDRVELLEGVVVAMSPISPPHAVATEKTAAALRAAVGARAVVRVQQPLHVGLSSVPEPDVAVVPGTHDDYAGRHPETALLVVEVAESTLVQDRLTKAMIYAAAGVPEYWIVNLRDDCVEVRHAPDAAVGRYLECRTVPRGGQIALDAFGATVAVDELLPGRAG